MKKRKEQRDWSENTDKNWHYASGEWASFLKEKRKRRKSKFGERSFFRQFCAEALGKVPRVRWDKGIDIAKLDDEFVRVTQNAHDTYHANHRTAGIPLLKTEARRWQQGNKQ